MTKPMNPRQEKIEIDHDVPLPNGKSYLSATLRTMKVGDSFLTHLPYHSVYQAARRLGLKITSRKELDRLRIWVTATKR